jgi:putative transposase
MPQSLSIVYVHLVFSMKDRRPSLRDQVIRRDSQAEWVKELKRVSNRWLKDRGADFDNFEWQGGYADFSVSPLEPGTGSILHS